MVVACLLSSCFRPMDGRNFLAICAETYAGSVQVPCRCLVCAVVLVLVAGARRAACGAAGSSSRRSTPTATAV
eukprot:scaffold11827_cov107-Isochrysis_galbana.AAC.7